MRYCLVLLLLVGCQSERQSAELTALKSSLQISFSDVVQSQELATETTISELKANTESLNILASKIETLKASTEATNSDQSEEVIQSAESGAVSIAAPDSSQPVLFLPPAIDEPAVQMSWNIEGNWNPTLIETADHLRDDHGVNIDGKTHQELHDIHAAIHNGTSVVSHTRSTKSVVDQISPVMSHKYRFSASCPGGVCPPRRVTFRRRR